MKAVMCEWTDNVRQRLWLNGFSKIDTILYTFKVLITRNLQKSLSTHLISGSFGGIDRNQKHDNNEQN